MTEIERLQAKLKAREGKPGFASNVEGLKVEIGRLEALTFTYKSKVTGQFVTAEFALANPTTTYRVEPSA